MTGQILSLMICYIVPISEKGNAISTLYPFWRKAYQSYIVLENEGGRPQKDMEQLYHCPISGYITFAESSITVLYPAGYWHKQIWHQINFLVDDSFYCRRIPQTCPFLPQEKFPVKPSAFESEIHPSHKPSVCTLCISPLQGAWCGYAPKFVNGHLSVHSQGEVCCVQRNSFIQMSKLSNVRGRITYISSHAKQENLYAAYETTERSFWRELALCNQHEFQKSGTEGKCIEARELIIALPEDLVQYEPEYVLGQFTKHFRYRYGVECISALHHNKAKTNYHIHLIFSERKVLDEPVVKTATRNMFYDESGKRMRTKKEILDVNGNVRKKCRVIKKGKFMRKCFLP